MNSLDNVYAFWTGYYGSKNVYEWASNKAYLDMCRTLTFREITKGTAPKEEKDRIEKQRKIWRNEGSKIIKKAIVGSYKDFEDFHKKTCDELIEYYQDKLEVALTYGQAQKWLNMTLKYLWLLWRLGMIRNDDTLNCFIEHNCGSFHVPLDSYILRYVAKKKNKNKQVPPDIGLESEIQYHKEYKEAWSKIADYDEWYKGYQEDIRKHSRKKYTCPLEWELEHWQKSLDHYNVELKDK